ncbi:hypothetical protein MBLNU230_g2705t1 [Neophaeotheca triangularis]
MPVTSPAQIHPAYWDYVFEPQGAQDSAQNAQPPPPYTIMATEDSHAPATASNPFNHPRSSQSISRPIPTFFHRAIRPTTRRERRRAARTFASNDTLELPPPTPAAPKRARGMLRFTLGALVITVLSVIAIVIIGCYDAYLLKAIWRLELARAKLVRCKGSVGGGLVCEPETLGLEFVRTIPKDTEVEIGKWTLWAMGNRGKMNCMRMGTVEGDVDEGSEEWICRDSQFVV